MAAKKPQPASSSVESTGGESGLLKKQSLGRYELKKKLGAGGMGAVYLALDTQLNRLVALKVLPPEKAENPTLVKRFKAEAQAVAQLTHDNIVRVYESGEIEGYHYIALEYVEGTDVQRLIKKRGRIPVRRATEIITQVARALEHASQSGIVHRDVKPANLLITQAGIVKLTDLGLARVLDENEETSITRAGTTVGTVDYMSPEQARSSKAADIRSDIYSLGCTWYHMLTGLPPYPEGSVTNKLQAHAVSRIPDPRQISEAVPETIVGVLQRMMAKKPEDRYQTVEELLSDLQAVKASKKEISADDLAALAGGDEEIIPTGRTSRVQASDEGDTQSAAAYISPVTTKTNSGRSTNREKQESNGSSSQAMTLPPREKKTLAETEPEPKKQFNTEPLIYIGLVLGLVVLVGGAGYIISGVGSAIDRSDDKKVNLLEQAQQNQEQFEGAGGQSPAEAGSSEATQQVQTQSVNGNSPQQVSHGPETGVMPTGTVPVSKQGLPEETWPAIRLIDSHLPVDEGSAHSLQEAINKTKAKELIVELQTTGFYRWDQPLILDGRSLLLRKSAESPGTILLNSAGGLTNGLVTIRKGQLILDGLHFGLLGYDLPGTAPLTLLKVLDADLSVKNCSFTFEESRAAPVTLCEISQSGPKSRRCHWENTLVRGTAWKPFDITARKLKLLVEECLFFLADQPMFTLNHPAGNSDTALNGDLAEREIALSNTWVITSGTPLTVHNTTQDLNVPPTQFRFQQSRFASGPQTAERPFLSIQNWPENALSTAGTAKLSFINWISEASQFSGWNQRLNGTTNQTRATYQAADDAQWQEFWGNPELAGDWSRNRLSAVTSDQFEQAFVNSLTTMGFVSPTLSAAQIAEQWQNLRQPSLPEATWRASLVRSTQPSLKPQPIFGGDVPRLKVDLSRQDLGEFLASPELPAKAIIEARGFGLRTSSPLRVQNKHVKIQFLSDRGRPPLTLRPVPARGDSSGKNFPWIMVENGSLTLDAGVFRLEQVARNPLPSCWIESRNSQIELVKCYVTGPISAQKALPSLIKVTGAGSGTAQPLLSLDQCFLHYGGTLIDIDLQTQRLKVEQSVLVSQGHLFHLRYAGGNKPSPGVFEWSHNTFSGRQGSIHFDVAAPASAGKPFVNGFVQENVFAAAADLEEKISPAAALLTASFPLQELPGRVWWWGTRNGFSPELAKTFKTGDLAEVWPSYWGAGHVTDSLFGAEGVLLEQPVLKAKDLRPSALTLFPKSKAAQWGEGEKPIGANCAALDLSEYEVEKKPDTPGNPANKPEQKPQSPRF